MEVIVFCDLLQEEANVCSVMCQCEGAIAVTMFRPPLLFVLGQFIAKRANLNSILAPAQQWSKIMTLLLLPKVRKVGRQSQTKSFPYVMC